MTPEQAADYAPQWGSYVTSGDPGAVMYGDTADPDTARAMAVWIRSECQPIAQAGDCCGTGGPCQADLEALEALLGYLDETGAA